MFFLPLRNDPKKTHKQNFGTHPVPGQSRKFVYVYVFFLSPSKIARLVRGAVKIAAAAAENRAILVHSV